MSFKLFSRLIRLTTNWNIHCLTQNKGQASDSRLLHINQTKIRKMFWRPHWPSFEQPYSDRSVEDYIARTTRMPVVESSVYGHQNGHTMIKEERVIWEEQHNMHGNRYNYSFPSGGIHQGYRAAEAQKKVHFVERDRTTEVKDKKFHNEDDSFIQRNNNSNMYVNRSKYNFPSGYHHGSPPPEAQKKAHFVEHDRTTEVGRKEKHKVSEEKVDNEADNFIKRKHKNFELSKMDTFKVY
ncbi:hypothetical protein RDI58_008546 [Solanum bulbocastanum]|uniref:Uncharacterized protein n=1 Tax=Solanum bulbocastanum TaxID=147425 RepID=A0AAN8TV80_SOLBU